MTTGDALVQHSPLPSGTALAHLLALQAGTGQGTVFASMFALRCDEPRLTLVQRAKRADESAFSCHPTAVDATGELGASILTQLPRCAVLTRADAMILFSGAERASFFVRAEDERITVTDTDILEMD